MHINSSITNHWFYLLVEGGSNAGEALGHGHGGPAVTAINQADAEEIAFLGFIGLTSGADMADARDATVAAAETLFGASSQQYDSTMYAWCAVGVGGACGPTDALPTVSITSPLDGATVSGNVPITADASDDVGVTQVEFFVDGASIGVDTIAPYAVSWDSTTLTDGSHTMDASATDSASNTNDADQVTVAVDNVDDDPAASIVNPTDGSTVSGTVTIQVDATDDRDVQGNLDVTKYPLTAAPRRRPPTTPPVATMSLIGTPLV